MAGTEEIAQVGLDLPLYGVIPFILMLLSIAILPIFAHHFWESNKNKLIVALVLGIPTAVWIIVIGGSQGLELLEHSVIFDYIPFIILLGSLFVISGGIFVSGNIQAKPITNTIILAIGAVLASFMGTTGAAMLLIRPIININKERKYKQHTLLFFIAIVANCGGLLTPLGDPPLLMMYLRGAPFEWFFKLVPEWLFVNAILLIIYFIFDTIKWKKEPEDLKILDLTQKEPIRVHGKLNFVWLVGVVLSIAFLNPVYFDFIKMGTFSQLIQNIPIVAMLILSLIFTKQETRKQNHFSWEPILEVVYLFLGIFITMVPCLVYLEKHAVELGVTSPSLFYHFTGALSSFLDNTPTAVTFHSLALGLKLPAEVAGIPEIFLKAICVSAVFFGSVTYIGNGPNFMVKAIAENSGIKTPHFFAYMYMFSLPILVPLFIIVEFLFILH